MSFGNQTTIRVAAIGTGWVCRHRHLPIMDRDPTFEVVGVVDECEERARRVARQRGYRHHFGGRKLEDVPWLSEVDAVTVSTSPESHYPLVKAALLRDLPVLTEKPFAMNVAQGEELVDLSRARGVPLAVVHNFQFARSARKLFEDVSKGALGELSSVMAVQMGNPERRLPVWYEKLPCGLFYDESPHLLYLLRRMSGRPLELLTSMVFPSSNGLKTPAFVHAEFRGYSPSGDRPFTLRCNFESPISEWYFAVFGKRAVGFVDLFRDLYIILPNDGAHGAAQIIRTSLVTTLQHWYQHLPSGLSHLRGDLFYGNEEVFARFARAIRAREWDPPDIGARSALDVLTMQHQVINAQRTIGASSSSDD